MKSIMFSVVLMSVIACGGSGSSASKGSEENPLVPCGSKTLCIEPLKHILNTRLTNMSGNLRLNLVRKEEGREDRKFAIVDSCLTPGAMKIISNTTGSSIFFSHNPFLNAQSSLELMDLGEDCKGTEIIVQSDLTDETFRFDANSRTINVDLD